jgi:hypothetical protein
VGAKGIRKFAADHFFGLHSWASAPERHFQPQLLGKLDGSLVRQNGTSAGRDARPELVQRIHCNGSQFRSAVVPVRPLWHLACLCHVVGAMKYFGGHMAKIIEFYIPQSFRKASKWISPAERGKVLAFPLAVRKSA